MPIDPATGDQIRAQVAAELAYHVGDGIVPMLPSIKNPTLIITASNDLTNPPANQARAPGSQLWSKWLTRIPCRLGATFAC